MMPDADPTSLPHRDQPERRRESIAAQLAEHVRVASALDGLIEMIDTVALRLRDSLSQGGVVYTLGNGGSAADAQHFSGELIGHYKRDRRPLAAVTLSTDATVMTCIANDYNFDEVFSRQVQALVRPGDVVVAFSTSGRSANVVSAMKLAQSKGACSVFFGGAKGGPAAAYADYVFLAPSRETARIQEMHTFILHALSESLDEWAAETEPAVSTL